MDDGIKAPDIIWAGMLESTKRRYMERYGKMRRLREILGSLALCCLLILALPVSVRAATETEPNDSFESAQSIKTNEAVEGNILNSNDIDCYIFELTSPGSVSINVDREYRENPAGRWQVGIYDGDHEKLAEYSFLEKSTESDIPPIGLSAGKYYIKITGALIYDRAYHLTVKYVSSDDWETESNDSFQNADQISLNTPVNGRLMSNLDEDYYMIELPSPGAVDINFDRDYKEGSGAEWKVTIYDRDYKEMAEHTFSEKSTESTIPPIGLNAGKYYIKIRSYGYSDAVYRLTAGYKSSDVWETENNDSFQEADSIRLNTSISGGLMCDQDADYYAFELSSPGPVGIKFDHEYKEGSTASWNVEVYDGSYERMAIWNFDERSAENSVPPVGLPAGKFFIKITGHNSNATYSLTAQYTSSDAWETENNGSFQKADSIFLDASVSGGLMSSEDADYYTFDLPSSGAVNISFAHESGMESKARWQVGIYDGRYKGLKGYTFYENSAQEDTEPISLPAGKYYIKVTPYGYSDKTYELKVNNYVFVNSISLSRDSLIMTAGEQVSLSAKAFPENANNPSVTWSSDKPGIATVDSNGVVRAVNTGTAAIIATASDGSGVKATCTVTVGKKPYGNYTGLKQSSSGQWLCVLDGQVQNHYTGLWSDPNLGWWYVENGVVNFDYSGLYCDAGLGWWLINGGAVNFGYTGLYCDANYGWWLINGGTVDFGYTGLYCDTNYGWWLINGGTVDFGYTGLYCDADYGWWLINGGTMDFGYTGLYCDADYGWWLINGGTMDFGYTGLYCDANYGWWLIDEGTVNFDYTGLYCDADYGWWLISGGSVAFDYAGLWGDPTYGWWLINGGTVNFDYTGLYCDANCGWWLVGDGSVAFGYNGLVPYGDSWWCVAGGSIASDYTGLWYDETVGWWYVDQGTIAFDYTGAVEYDGNTYYVESGCVIF